MSRRQTTREKLAELLRDAGYNVEAKDISGAKGWYRIEQKYDDRTVCWEASATKTGESSVLRYFVYSRATMTECARRGITLIDDGGLPPQVEVIPKT
jgi:hypothetical protein